MRQATPSGSEQGLPPGAILARHPSALPPFARATDQFQGQARRCRRRAACRQVRRSTDRRRRGPCRDLASSTACSSRMPPSPARIRFSAASSLIVARWLRQCSRRASRSPCRSCSDNRAPWRPAQPQWRGAPSAAPRSVPGPPGRQRRTSDQRVLDEGSAMAHALPKIEPSLSRSMCLTPPIVLTALGSSFSTSCAIGPTWRLPSSNSPL